MAKQTTYGKAFEYACLISLYNRYSPSQSVIIHESPQYDTAKSKFFSLDAAIKYRLIRAARAACVIIDRLEPQLNYPSAGTSPLVLSLQADEAGQKGDVRDVICLRKGNNWEIGLSCKHNHEAVKHSRLSATINFGKDWFGKTCSDSYFSKVVPIFNELAELRALGRSRNKPIMWRDLPDKLDKYYVPILEAFMEELNRIDAQYPNEIPAKLVEYLLGKNDFYKVITDDKFSITKVQVINLYGTLYRSSGNHKSIGYSAVLKKPTRFFHIGFKPNSKNTIEVICDEGWNISMRIHSAKSEVEPSLKFDVQLEALPSSAHTEIEPW